MRKNAKKASITLPADLEASLKRQAQKEHRTLSGIVQEASRYYLTIRAFETAQQKLAFQARRLGITTEEQVDELIHEIRRK